MSDTLDPFAPIEPGVGMAGIRLRTHIRDCFEIIKDLNVKGDDILRSNKGVAYLQSPYHVAYELNIGITLVFNMVNGRIYRISADQRYQGTLFGVLRAGMPFQEAVKLEPRLEYDDMEELYRISGVHGVSVDTDGWNNRIEAISVYVVELTEALETGNIEAFERGEWT